LRRRLRATSTSSRRCRSSTWQAFRSSSTRRSASVAALPLARDERLPQAAAPRRLPTRRLGAAPARAWNEVKSLVRVESRTVRPRRSCRRLRSITCARTCGCGLMTARSRSFARRRGVQDRRHRRQRVAQAILRHAVEERADAPRLRSRSLLPRRCPRSCRTLRRRSPRCAR
jgi:hypothetical protein